jgi:hypothetical protein
MSYNGHLGFGLLGDYDTLPELERIAREVKQAITSLAEAAGLQGKGRRTRTARPGKPARATEGRRVRGSREALADGGKHRAAPSARTRASRA